jgi:pyruvate-formate lyase-activating enzyme
MKDVIDLLFKAKPKSITVLSGDPVPNSDYSRLPGTLKAKIGCKVRLLTNGYILPDLDGVTHVSMSIKALDDELHKRYTGKSNKNCLENFRLIYKKGIELSASSVLIPGLIGDEEVERVAAFISTVDFNIPYRIIGYVKVDGMPYREPDREELDKVADRARRHLKNVIFSHSEKQDYTGIIDLFTNNLRR